MDPRKHTPRHIIITLPKIKEKERILKVAREKKTVIYKEVPIRLSADFSIEIFRKEGVGEKYSKSLKARTYNLDYSIQQS